MSTEHAARATSNTSEWYTPPAIIEAARATMGGIDLDPLSCAAANRIMQASAFYGEGSDVENGYDMPWIGRVFVNPPGGRCDKWGAPVQRRTGTKGYFYADGKPCPIKTVSAAKMAWQRLAAGWAGGCSSEAMFVGYSVEILQTTQVCERGALVPLDFPLCFPKTRVAFIGEDGKPKAGMTHSSVIVYLPNHTDKWAASARFAEHFAHFGRVINWRTR